MVKKIMNQYKFTRWFIVKNVFRRRQLGSGAICLRIAIKDRRPEKLSKGIGLIHDNATLHSVKITKELLRKFKWEV